MRFAYAAPMIVRGARTLAACAVSLTLTACFLGRIFSHSGKAPVPTRSLGDPGADRTCLFVFVPGIDDHADAFTTWDFPGIARRAGVPCDMLGADVGVEYFHKGSVEVRLEQDVLAPARQRGYTRIWLVGVSLGALAVALYEAHWPGRLAGAVLLAPYLGSSSYAKRIAAAGGLRAWTQPPCDEEQEVECALWAWARGLTMGREGSPVFLSYGQGDGFAEAQGLLASALPPDRVTRVAGGHTWPTWAALWTDLVTSPTLLPQTGARQSASAVASSSPR
jgi:pimeloyl-ACP methyl ester carboxylesterase